MHDDLFHTLDEAPADPILGVSARFARDNRAEKVNLGVGAYLDTNGNPTTLEVVRQEETALAGTPGGSRHRSNARRNGGTALSRRPTCLAPILHGRCDKQPDLG